MSVDTAQLVTNMLRDLGITPRGVQVTAIEKGLLEGKSVMVSSPTGSGKTLIGEMALVRGVQDGHIGLYLVPLRALAMQVAEGLRERYSDFNIQIGLSTGDFHKNGDELETSDIIVKPGLSERPNQVIVDNENSSFFTIIEVFNYDFPGLLFSITDALFRCGLDIWVAKVATKVDQVVDVFYVRDFDGEKVDRPDQEETIKQAILAVLPKALSDVRVK